jgi:hypothetical protein
MAGFGIPGAGGKPPAAVVMVPSPPPGTYTITPNPGSAPITAVLDAAGTLPPKLLSSSLSAKGSRRVARFLLGPTRGYTVTLAEEGSGVEHALGRAKAGRNKVTFTPANGPGGRRKLVALMANDTGVITTKRTIATFVAPSPAKPARPKVKVKRSGTSLRVTWKTVRGAKRYTVAVSLSDGRKLAYTTKRAKVSVPGVGKNVTGSVSVTAQAGAQASPRGTARLHR